MTGARRRQTLDGWLANLTWHGDNHVARLPDALARLPQP